MSHDNHVTRTVHYVTWQNVIEHKHRVIIINNVNSMLTVSSAYASITNTNDHTLVKTNVICISSSASMGIHKYQTVSLIPASLHMHAYSIPYWIHLWYLFFALQALYDLMVEAVFPTCAIFLNTCGILCDNADCLLALKSGKAHREIGPQKCFIAGSRGEGLTLETRWGHPSSDGDVMLVIGKYLGVTIPRDQRRTCQSPQRSLSASISQGCNGNSCLEYAPENCPSGYSKLKVTDILGLMEYKSALFDCVEKVDDHNWLNTARLKQVIIQGYNDNYEDDPGDNTVFGRTTGISGPAAQVI